MAKLMKQAQQMQASMQKMQEDLGNRLYEGSAGGGAVTATCTGGGDLKSIRISPDIVKDGDVEMLQDLIVTAVTDASGKAKAEAQKELGKLTGGMGLPSGLGF